MLGILGNCSCYPYSGFFKAGDYEAAINALSQAQPNVTSVSIYCYLHCNCTLCLILMTTTVSAVVAVYILYSNKDSVCVNCDVIL